MQKGNTVGGMVAKTTSVFGGFVRACGPHDNSFVSRLLSGWKRCQKTSTRGRGASMPAAIAFQPVLRSTPLLRSCDSAPSKIPPPPLSRPHQRCIPQDHGPHDPGSPRINTESPGSCTEMRPQPRYSQTLALLGTPRGTEWAVLASVLPSL